MRVRTTLAASLVVGLAFVVASVVLLMLLDRSLTSGVRDAASARAEAVAIAGRAGEQPPLDSGEADDEFVQVTDPQGRVVASSTNLAGEPLLARVPAGREVQLDQVPFEDGAFLVVAATVSSRDGPQTIVVGRSLDDVSEATAALAPLLAAGVPVLVLVIGVVTWWIAGWALQPVETLRAEVEHISAGALDRRVPEPDTGDEIARLADTMNRMLGRLEESQARQRRFISDAAHELRSPVASIRQHSEVAIAHPESTSTSDLAKVVRRENLRVERLVDDLLLLARIDEGAHAIRAQVDLDDVALEEATRLRASTTLTIETSGVGPARVGGNREELERAFRNLTENAARHAVNVVTLSVSEVAGRAVVTIDDDGPGIDAGDRERVFERFVRLDDARTRTDGGAGLGLAIVRAVVEAHGGVVTLGAGAIGGARAEVLLPIFES